MQEAIPDAIRAPLTLAQAVETLNRVRHEETTWVLHNGEVWQQFVGREMISPLTAIAVAEYYLRHGITAWPGWGWEA